MPLIVIKFDTQKVLPFVLKDILRELPAIAAKTLSCEEGGELKPEDIMFEVDPHGPYDLNVKELQLRVYAHDYPSRLARLDEIRKDIENHLTSVLKTLYREQHEPSWYVWVLLSPTSYGSDTES
jgi:hypothetical protein